MGKSMQPGGVRASVQKTSESEYHMYAEHGTVKSVAPAMGASTPHLDRHICRSSTKAGGLNTTHHQQDIVSENEKR